MHEICAGFIPYISLCRTSGCWIWLPITILLFLRAFCLQLIFEFRLPFVFGSNVAYDWLLHAQRNLQYDWYSAISNDNCLESFVLF